VNDLHNPYLPPKSEVGIGPVEPQQARPPSVFVALILVGIVLVIGLGGIVNSRRLLEFGASGVAAFVFKLAGLALNAWVWVSIARGRNWARILLAVLAGLRALNLVVGFWTMTQALGTKLLVDRIQVAWMLLPIVLQLTAVWLLFGPGRGWFARRQ